MITDAVVGFFIGLGTTVVGWLPDYDGSAVDGVWSSVVSLVTSTGDIVAALNQWVHVPIMLTMLGVGLVVALAVGGLATLKRLWDAIPFL